MAEVALDDRVERGRADVDPRGAADAWVRFAAVVLWVTWAPEPPCTLMPWKPFRLETDAVTELEAVRSSRMPIDALPLTCAPMIRSLVPSWSLMPYDAEPVTDTSRTTECVEPSRKTPAPAWPRIVNPCTVTSRSPRTRNPYCRTLASSASPALGCGPPRSTYSLWVEASKNQVSVAVRATLVARDSRALPLDTPETTVVAPSFVDHTWPPDVDQVARARLSEPTTWADLLDATNLTPLGTVTCSR